MGGAASVHSVKSLQQITKEEQAEKGNQGTVYESALLSRCHGVRPKAILHILLKSCKRLGLGLEGAFARSANGTLPILWKRLRSITTAIVEKTEQKLIISIRHLPG